MKFAFSRQVFENYSNAKFYENPSKEEQVFRADGLTGSRQTDIPKPIVAFRNFANAPNNNNSSASQGMPQRFL
jgi:hypothetical protein